MTNNPTPPRGWRLVDKTKDVRTADTPLIGWGDGSKCWVALAPDEYFLPDYHYAVPISWSPNPPTINDVPWITYRVPTADDACDNGMVLLCHAELDHQAIPQHWQKYPLGTPWIPLNKTPPPKREPGEWWAACYADGSINACKYKEDAEYWTRVNANARLIKVREVIEDQQ